MDKIAIIILAAGNSSRLGRPKQLQTYRGKTLLDNVIVASIAAALHPVIVITGAYRNEIWDSLQGQPVNIIHNPDWATGMASGIVAGLEGALGAEPALNAVIVAVCDQPHLSADHLRALLEAKSGSGKHLIASSYSDTLGTPVLIGRPYFRELLTLTGDSGAKQLLKRYPSEIATVPFPKGDIDIDTAADLEMLYRIEEKDKM